jgi:hypothetical protein
MLRKIVLVVSLLCLLHGAHAAELQPLYHEGFDSGKIDGPLNGKTGKAGASLNVSAPGKIDLDRGTLAFFTKFDNTPPISEWNILGGVLPVGFTGYWGMLMGFDVRKTEFIFNFYDAGLYAPPLKLGAFWDDWKAGEWHHLAATWDKNQGVNIYQDGKKVASNWGGHRWQWNCFPETLFVSNPVDEVYTFSDPLTDVQIAQLSHGEKPTGEPLPFLDQNQQRAVELARMGWNSSSISEIPTVNGNQTKMLTFARVVNCMDAKRPVAQVFENYPGDTWPLLQYGASIRGKHLDIQLAKGSSYDHIRVYAQRSFSGAFAREDGRVLTSVKAAEPMIWQRDLGNPLREERLTLNRDFGRIGQIDFYRVDNAPKLNARELESFTFQKARTLPDGQTAQALQAETPTRFQQFALATKHPVSAWKLSAPAFGGFQATSEITPEGNAYDGVLVKLVVEVLQEPTPVRIVIKEPVLGLRDWLVGDVVLVPKGSGRQVFQVFLKGRPVVPMPELKRKKYWKDGLYLDELETVPAVPFGFKITAANPLTFLMGDGGSTVTLHRSDLQKALPTAADDQVNYMREAYSQMMEAHGYQDPRMMTPTRWLAKFAPQRREFRQMYERMGRPQWFVDMNIPEFSYSPPKNLQGAPEWAFWQKQVMDEHRRLTYWEIDNLQLSNGEMGGVWNDDTDHWENALDYALCMDDNDKIKNAYRKFIDGLWKEQLQDGVGKYVQDSLHYYEEGMGALSMRMLLDYGDPVTFNRTLAAASHVPQWVFEKGGKWYQRSVFIGPNEMWLARDFDLRDKEVPPTEILVPGGYLYWYNRMPSITKYFNTTPGYEGLFLNAVADRINGLDEARKQYELNLQKPLGRYGAMAPNTWIDEIGVSGEVKKAHATPFQDPGPIANYEGMLDTGLHWFRYKTTGDIRWLSEDYKRVWEWFQRMDWIVTEARPSLDRNPLPRYSLIRARMGSLAAHRAGTGASTLRWPEHAITYTKGADDVAALVFENLDIKLAARFYAFTDTPHDMQIRLWRLNPGTYQISLALDKNDDGVADNESTLLEKQMTIERGTFLDLTLPPRVPTVLTITPIETHKPDYEKPDPAIGTDTIEYVYGEHLVVHVYNLGSKPIENLVVRVRDGKSGKIVVEGEQVIKHLDAPLDFKPKEQGLEFKNINANTYESIIVELDPDGKIDDLNRFNNRVVLDYRTKGWTQ